MQEPGRVARVLNMDGLVEPHFVLHLRDILGSGHRARLNQGGVARQQISQQKADHAHAKQRRDQQSQSADNEEQERLLISDPPAKRRPRFRRTSSYRNARSNPTISRAQEARSASRASSCRTREVPRSLRRGGSFAPP